MRKKIQTVEKKYLRRIQGLSTKDRVRNDKIKDDLNVKPITTFKEKIQLNWLQRMVPKGPVKRVWQARTMNKKKRGGRRGTWS